MCPLELRYAAPSLNECNKMNMQARQKWLDNWESEKEREREQIDCMRVFVCLIGIHAENVFYLFIYFLICAV